MTSSLVRENSVLLHQQLRVAEESADFQKDMSYFFSFLEGTDPEPELFMPQLTTAEPSRERWMDALERRYSMSSTSFMDSDPFNFSFPSSSLASPSAATSSFAPLPKQDLAKTAFKPHAPAVDIPRAEKAEPVVTLRDLELFAPSTLGTVLEEEEEEGVNVSADAHADAGVGMGLVRKHSVSQSIKAWLGEDDGLFEIGPPISKPDHNALDFLLNAPSPTPSLSIGTSTPSAYSAELSDEDEDDEDEYVPMSSTRKRTRRVHTSAPASRQSYNHIRAENSPKKPRTLPSTSALSYPSSSHPSSQTPTQLHCLFHSCSAPSFSNVRDRNRHMETHFPDREHPRCAACNKQMSRPDSVKRHQNSVAGRACRIALAGKPGATVPEKPWCVGDEWRKELSVPPTWDPLYTVWLEKCKGAMVAA
ncbi:hypothetical protein BXZ70DRAFT_126310 [Cristinia sonorae]|uniref:C2H2-type domain-containing protein n=1 Tax=Cristinia sonorae TaxID=1940300 RepID=A0A8K0UQY0_9AGAR|nr:hypothetical protein BXZ70DRAFT_126310 [Cristinia sonorae]